ncbi:MAG: FkbM family methyltransferase [Bacteroidota bacterium]
MLKKLIQAVFQSILGFERYLFWFSRFKIHTLHLDSQKKEGDFFHFLTLLSPSDHVLDIGANIGIMTVHLAKACPQGNISAFEPVPDNFQTLKKIVAHYQLPNVALHPIALGNQRSKIQMAMPIMKGVRMQGLSYVTHPSIEGYETEHNAYEVAQWPLDEFGPLQGQAVHAIKMDVENYEQFVLAGGKRLLQTHHPIIYTELWDNDNRQACIQLLEKIGYQCFVFTGQSLVLFDPHQHSQHNFFFLPEKADSSAS